MSQSDVNRPTPSVRNGPRWVQNPGSNESGRRSQLVPCAWAVSDLCTRPSQVPKGLRRKARNAFQRFCFIADRLNSVPRVQEPQGFVSDAAPPFAFGRLTGRRPGNWPSAIFLLAGSQSIEVRVQHHVCEGRSCDRTPGGADLQRRNSIFGRGGLRSKQPSAAHRTGDP